jgi:hypothetical protein
MLQPGSEDQSDTATAGFFISSRVITDRDGAFRRERRMRNLVVSKAANLDDNQTLKPTHPNPPAEISKSQKPRDLILET